jgi:hypothetical protein
MSDARSFIPRSSLSVNGRHPRQERESVPVPLIIQALIPRYCNRRKRWIISAFHAQSHDQMPPTQPQHSHAAPPIQEKRNKLRRSPSTLDEESECRGHPTCYTPFTTAELHGSKDAFDILNNICTPASLLFDPRFTSRQRPSALPPFRTFPPSPTAQRIPYSLPSTISVQNLDTEEPAAEMDKRHPSSFQQLEKLGEGTYATVR